MCACCSTLFVLSVVKGGCLMHHVRGPPFLAARWGRWLGRGSNVCVFGPRFPVAVQVEGGTGLGRGPVVRRVASVVEPDPPAMNGQSPQASVLWVFSGGVDAGR